VGIQLGLSAHFLELCSFHISVSHQYPPSNDDKKQILCQECFGEEKAQDASPGRYLRWVQHSLSNQLAQNL